MQVQSVNSLTPTYKDTKRTTLNDFVDKDTFYNLLITQLQNQDPLSPMKPENFTAQLAQLSQLEAVRNVSDNVDALLSYHESIEDLMAVNLIGKGVVVTSNQDDSAKADSPRRVTGFEINDGKILLDLDDGSTVSLNQVKSIQEIQQ